MYIETKNKVRMKEVIKMKFKEIVTHKELTQKAFEFYCQTDPINIKSDGETYKLTGCFGDYDFNSIDEVNEFLEGLADEFAEED